MIRNVEITRPIPDEAKTPCRAPVLPPDRRLSQREITGFWGIDRQSLIECEKRRALAVGG